MKRCKICHVEAELVDGRCHSCRMAKEATDHGMTYGKYHAMVSPPRDEPIRNRRGIAETKKCPWCGAEFIPVRSNQVYCCVTCYHSSNYQSHREKVLEKAKVKTRPAPRICAECGREFIPQRNDPRLKFCTPKCCAVAGNRAATERRRAKREQKRLLAEASENAAELA